jgi:hypothetical protein
MNVGDLVKECIPLEAGDAHRRIGIVLEAPHPSALQWYKVLFDKAEMVHYNSLERVET